MSDPLVRTFDALASTANPQAGEVLLAALDVPDARIRAAAAGAIIRRTGSRGQVELLRRWAEWDAATRDVIARQAGALAGTVRQCVLHGDPTLRQQALEFIRRTELYEVAPTLLTLLAGKADVPADDIAETLQHLTNRLYEHCQHYAEELASGTALRGIMPIRHSLLVALDQSLGEFDRLRRPDVVVESVLALGDPDCFAVRKALSQAAPACRDLAAGRLNESRHPGVMQLVLDFLSKNYPHPKAFEALQTRRDIEFVSHLLRWFPARLSPLQQKNIRQVESLAWLGPGGLLDVIPPPLQPALVSLLAASGLPTDEKLRVQEWLVRNGGTEGRLAAAEVLVALDRRSVRQILFEGLESADEQVQAWATGQLRHHGIPQAVALLMERLDSPSEAVRAAARAELQGFTLDRALVQCDQLEPLAARRLGELLLKIDPECLPKLMQELRHPIRRRRVRAAAGSQALGLHVKLIPYLLEMLDDEDAIVRRTAVEALSDVPSADVRESLGRMLADPSPRVREAAERAIEALRRPGPSASSAMTGNSV